MWLPALYRIIIPTSDKEPADYDFMAMDGELVSTRVLMNVSWEIAPTFINPILYGAGRLHKLFCIFCIRSEHFPCSIKITWWWAIIDSLTTLIFRGSDKNGKYFRSVQLRNWSLAFGKKITTLAPNSLFCPVSQEEKGVNSNPPPGFFAISNS